MMNQKTILHQPLLERPEILRNLSKSQKKVPTIDRKVWVSLTLLLLGVILRKYAIYYVSIVGISFVIRWVALHIFPYVRGNHKICRQDAFWAAMEEDLGR